MELQRHRGRWTVRYRDADGVRRRKSLPKGLPEALTDGERSEILAEVEAALRGDARGGGTFADFLGAHEDALVARWKRPGCVMPVLRRVAAKLGTRDMGGLSAVEAEDIVHSLGVARSTFRVYVAYLRTAWSEAERRGWCEANPWRGVRCPKADLRDVPALTGEEMARLFSACSPRARPVLEFLYETGLRVGEATSLVVEDLAGDSVTVRKSKSGRPRVVPLSLRAAEILAAAGPARGIGAPRAPFGAIRPPALLGELARACARAGLPRLRVHDLRHLCAVRLVRLGANLHDVKELLGHSSILMTERYAGHAPDAGARRAIAALHRETAFRTPDRSILPG